MHKIQKDIYQKCMTTVRGKTKDQGMILKPAINDFSSQNAHNDTACNYEL